MPCVYWITGLSGAGKTTIGSALYQRLRKEDPCVVFLDGDALREVFGDVFGYSGEERRRCAMCYSRLCKLLAEQGLTVVCCTISMFDSVRDWNRENIPGYVEVYVKASQSTLRRRDQKGLYSGLGAGLSSEVMGIDLAYEEPKRPDVILDSDAEWPVEAYVDSILKK